MRKMNLLTLLTTVLLGATFVNAQASRTWVSGIGDDANPCSRTSPCKTFAGAISKTAAGGEIDALDPGGFGALTITKSITIDGGGGQVASVLVAGTDGIVVAAGATDVVTLRNIRLNGLLDSATPGINGIRFLSGKVLAIEHCEITGFSNNGIDVATAGGQVFVNDTTVRNIGQSGLAVQATADTHVNINNSRFEANQFGVVAGNFSKINVINSEASGNSQIGFTASATSGTAELNVANSIAANNGKFGIQSGGGPAPATVRTTGVVLFCNPGGGFSNLANGIIQSWRNNFNSDSFVVVPLVHLRPE